MKPLKLSELVASEFDLMLESEPYAVPPETEALVILRAHYDRPRRRLAMPDTEDKAGALYVYLVDASNGYDRVAQELVTGDLRRDALKLRNHLGTIASRLLVHAAGLRLRANAGPNSAASAKGFV